MDKKRLFQDRSYAKRIKNISKLSQISIDLKPRRCDSDVYINQKIDVTNLVNYIEEKKDKGIELTYFHAFVTAIGKLIYNRKKLNWFVSNRHVYEHNDIIISFVAKLDFNDKSEEVMILVPISPNDNIISISNKIREKIIKIRSGNNKDEGANKAIQVLGKLPNIVRVPIIGLFKWCDKKGFLPKSLIKDNLYYSSIIVSNLGSIKCGAVYHNINDFGACSSLATMGEIKDELCIIEGKKVIRKICDFGINIDERIADGYYFAKSIKLLESFLDNPKMLEDRIDEKIENVEIR
ncbi:MAG: 2-oxo acid dehydrogenase subunit E2 [bacterium]|nr:2-oxo acid dehydrogenase subunit E2 [bacterium]